MAESFFESPRRASVTSESDRPRFRSILDALDEPIATVDPTAHAEVVALRAAAVAVGNYRLVGATLYATVEPCVMCMGAALNARVVRLVYGCDDPKAGAARSLFRLGEDPRLNHQLVVCGQVGADESRMLLREFFQARRC